MFELGDGSDFRRCDVAFPDQSVVGNLVLPFQGGVVLWHLAKRLASNFVRLEELSRRASIAIRRRYAAEVCGLSFGCY